MHYHEIDFYSSNTSRNYWYKYILGPKDYGVGIAWSPDKSPIFIIERVEETLIEEGTHFEPPIYEPEGVETIIVKPRLNRNLRRVKNGSRNLYKCV